MARPLAYITSVWSELELEAKEQALKYCRLVYEEDILRFVPNSCTMNF